MRMASPIIKQVYENQGAMYERIMVPITDGKRVFNIPCNLEEAYNTEGKSVVKQFEKVTILHLIDENWKDNLRQLSLCLTRAETRSLCADNIGIFLVSSKSDRGLMLALSFFSPLDQPWFLSFFLYLH